jgi:hypothetical protein
MKNVLPAIDKFYYYSLVQTNSKNKIHRNMCEICWRSLVLKWFDSLNNVTCWYLLLTMLPVGICYYLTSV